MGTTELEAAQSLLSSELTEGEEEQLDLGLEGEEAEDEEFEEAEEASTEDDDLDDDEEDTESESEEEPEMFTVSVDGTDEQVTLDELKRGYSGQKYVQKGMTQVAEMRKQTEAFANQLQQERGHVLQMFNQLQNGSVPTQPVAPSQADYANDPIGFMEAKIKFEEDHRNWTGQMQQIQGMQQQQQAQEAQAYNNFVRDEYRKLTEIDSDFADKEKATAIRDKMFQFGESVYGISKDEFQQIADHRAYRVLKDAVAYREMLAAQESARTKKRKPARKTKTARGGAKRSDTTAQTRARQKQMDRLKKSGSARDAAALLIQPS